MHNPLTIRKRNCKDNPVSEMRLYKNPELTKNSHPVSAGKCAYSCTNIPAIRGGNNRVNGADFQKNTGEDNCITGLNVKRIHRDVTVSQVQQIISAGKNSEEVPIKKLPTLSKKDKAIAPKIKQVEKKGNSVLSELKFPQVFVKNKGLEEILSAGLHRNIGLLKRDDSNSPCLISNKKVNPATKSIYNQYGFFNRHYTVKTIPSFHGIKRR